MSDRVLRCPDGPLVVDGPVTVRDDEGREHHSERPRVALCRCGVSSMPPWCDGSHKAVARRPGTERAGQ